MNVPGCCHTVIGSTDSFLGAVLPGGQHSIKTTLPGSTALPGEVALPGQAALNEEAFLFDKVALS